jgi:hypothetical protein
LTAAIDLLNVSKPDVSGEKLMEIGVFAKLCCVPASSIRYWVKVSKLTPSLKKNEIGLFLL